MKKILPFLFLSTLSIKSFSQQQQSSSFIHNLSVGVNLFGVHGLVLPDRLAFSPMLEARYNFGEHFVVEANTYRTLNFDKSPNSVIYYNNDHYSNLFIGFEGRFKISNRFKLLGGVYSGYDYNHFQMNDFNDKQTQFGIGPILGLECKLSPKFYLLSEYTIIYGPFRDNQNFYSNNYSTFYNKFDIPKFWSLEVFYRF